MKSTDVDEIHGYKQHQTAALTYSWKDKDKISNYIKNQQEHHRSESFKEELRRLLKEHGIEFLSHALRTWLFRLSSFRALGLALLKSGIPKYNNFCILHSCIQSLTHLTDIALLLKAGYIDTEGSMSFIPCAHALFVPCVVDDQKKVANPW